MTETQPIPAVIYAAKSTEDRAGSIPTQLDDCRAMAEREGWEVVGEFSEENVSAHQFTRRNIRGRGKIAEREDVQVTLNFDGIGSRPAKEAGYAALSAGDRADGVSVFNGFSLFYRLDTGLMKPRQVLRLVPKPDYVMYQ